ncbi:MAG TPA: AI-2E family transporter [Chitinophagaceae bacterium]|jgi:predicted PurR-regulated permease PerM
MQEPKQHFDLPFIARFTLLLVSTTCLLLLLYWGKLLFIPLFLAFLTAIFLYPAARLFERKHFGKSWAAVASMLLFLVFVSVILFFFNSQFLQFLKALPELKGKLDEGLKNAQSWVSNNYHVKLDPATGSVDSMIGKMASLAGTTLPIILEGLVLFVLFLFFSFYILYYRTRLENFILSLFKPTHKKKIREIAVELRSVINGYVKGLLLEMLIVTASSFFLLLILGIKYALVMAVFAGVLNLVPYLGIYVATAINTVLILATADLTKGLEVAAVFIFVHVIDANVILPRVVGRSVKINPFITLIAVLVGNLIWGVPGMFLFIPLTAILRVLGEKIKDFRSWAILIGEEEKEPIVKET